MFICFFIWQSTICVLLLYSAEYFQYFSLNFARTLGHAVDKLLNGSRVNSHGQFFLESFEFVSRQHDFPTKP